MGEKTTFIFTGDSFITRRLPEKGYEGFGELKEIIGGYDIRFNNLEITIHEGEGYPEVFSGGTWAMAEPPVLDGLTAYGFNFYNTANNHSGDYGHGGLLATIENLKKRNLCYAGTGKNLAEAAAPGYVETPNARVAMICACASFHPVAAAGNQRYDMGGRPGLNPLAFKETFHVTKEYFDMLQQVSDKTKMNAAMLKSIQNGYAPPLPEGKMNFGGLNFVLSDTNKLRTEPEDKDMARIALAIKEAKRQADYAVVSIHAHEDRDGNTEQPAEYLEIFARACIDQGADMVVGHGPHELRGIEIYKGKPIFYSIGNFIFQTETVSVQPADAYEKHGLPDAAAVGEYMDNRSKNGTRGYGVQPNIWRAVMAGVEAEGGSISKIILYPITLHMEMPRSRKGLPELEKRDETLRYLGGLSKPYGTQIKIENHIGIIEL